MRKSLFALILVLVTCIACQPAAPAIESTPGAPPPTVAPTSAVESTALPAPTPAPTATPVPVAARDAADPTAPPAPEPLDAGAGQIAFYSDRDGNPEIYTIRADSSGLARLTEDPAADDSPAFSPDGRQIAFLTARHDPSPRFPNFKYEIYVMDADGSNVRRLTDTPAAEDHPAWSPDGTRLLFDADYDGDGYMEIYAMNVDGTGLTRLTSNQANDQFADWSPDGTQIAFSSDRSGNWDLYVMGADGTNQQPLTDGPDWELFPAWSPDGTQIAFNGLPPRSRNTDVYVMPAPGAQGAGEARRLTDAPGFDENPAWSPDGTQIAFQTARDGTFEIYVMNADGSDPRPLAPYPAGELWPSWGPAAARATASTVAFEKSPQEFDERGTVQAGLGDLDGDGDLDAVLANPQSHNSEVWLNNGSGTLVDSGQQLTQYGHGVGVADFDGDGDLDAWIACHQFVTPSRIYFNDGTGQFRDSGQDLGDASLSAAEVNLVDLNGDGTVDVHVAYYDPNGLPDRVYLNDGRGTFTDSGLALEEETIAWGDLDGDGDADYFGKRWGEGYVVQLNDGRGRFAPGWQMDDPDATVGGVALADFDGDGDLDAVVANGFRSTGGFASRLLWNDGQARFVDSGQRLDETLGAELGDGDLDGDGDPDLYVANMDLPDEVWLNEGGRLVDSGLRLGEVPPAGYSTRPSFGDLDGDGDLDVFVGSLKGQPVVWFNQAVP